MPIKTTTIKVFEMIEDNPNFKTSIRIQLKEMTVEEKETKWLNVQVSDDNLKSNGRWRQRYLTSFSLDIDQIESFANFLLECKKDLFK